MTIKEFQETLYDLLISWLLATGITFLIILTVLAPAVGYYVLKSLLGF